MIQGCAKMFFQGMVPLQYDSPDSHCSIRHYSIIFDNIPKTLIRGIPS